MIEDFRDLLAELCRAEARFLVVGAHALAAHGVPRATVDFDEAWPDRIEAYFDDVLVPFIGQAAFIRNKQASGRLKDLADIEALGGE